MTQTFYEKIDAAVELNNSLLCVGIDPTVADMPQQFADDKANGLYEFGKWVVDQTHDLVCAYKPQIAHFAASKINGGMLFPEEQLQRLMEYIETTYPHIPLILDAKRGDIGSTAENYAVEGYSRYHAVAMTVNPYLGGDTIQPYMIDPLTKQPDPTKGVIILCKTSNDGSGDVQNIKLARQTLPNGVEIEEGTMLYQYIAKVATTVWNTNRQVALVVGATHAKELEDVRKLVGDDVLFLVPGVGAQGAKESDVVPAGQNSLGKGMVINSSRAIINPKKGTPREAAISTRDEINKYRKKVA